jgi:hypothetical protein
MFGGFELVRCSKPNQWPEAFGGYITLSSLGFLAFTITSFACAKAFFFVNHISL